MVVLNERDFMEVRMASLVADYDQEILANLYQPIIGFTGFAVYLSLCSEARNQKVFSIVDHNQFFNKMKINATQFIGARKLLEGIGLLKTFIVKNSGINVYHYEIYAPRNPSDFFNNTLLYGMFIQAVGESEATRIKGMYQIENPTQGEDISTTFVDAYKPDFDNPVFKKALNGENQIVGRRGAKIACEFSFSKFFDCLQSLSQINSESFTKKDMKEIERIATLYGLNEESAAHGVAQVYNPQGSKGNRVDFEALAKVMQDETAYRTIANSNTPTSIKGVSGESALSQKINLMEKTSPVKFLSALQNGTKPASSDVKIINDISANFGLSNGVINALVDYTLQTNNNVLSRAYVEKVAASLVREGATNAVDAMNYLNKVKKGRKKPISPVVCQNSEEIVEEVKSPIKKVSEKVETAKEADTLDWNSLIDQIDEGGSDGKA